MRPGMLADPVLNFTMVLPTPQLESVHVTGCPERLTTHVANTGEDVETSSMLLESACYRERADVRYFVVLRRRVRHARATCGRGLCGDVNSPNIIRLAWYELGNHPFSRRRCISHDF